MSTAAARETYALVHGVAKTILARDRKRNEEWKRDHGESPALPHPKDTLHALQLLTTAAALLQESRPVGRPKKAGKRER
jgi:hypothetical protein